jgi:hypothetical protein
MDVDMWTGAECRFREGGQVVCPLGAGKRREEAGERGRREARASPFIPHGVT